MLNVGARVPSFDITDLEGKRFHSGALPAKLWIALFRYAACPLCALRLHEMAGRWAKDLAHRGVTCLVISPSTRAQLERYVKDTAPPFSLVADPEQQLYGVLHPGYAPFGLGGGFLRRSLEARALGIKGGPSPSLRAAFRAPGDLIIDDAGLVRFAWTGRDFSDHAPFDDIFAALDRLP
jgi:peroxiredoxin